MLQGAMVAEDLSAFLSYLHALQALLKAVVVRVLPTMIQAASWVGLHSCENGTCPLQGFQQKLADLSPSLDLSETNSFLHITPEKPELMLWMLFIMRNLKNTPRAWTASHPYPQRSEYWSSG